MKVLIALILGVLAAICLVGGTLLVLVGRGDDEGGDSDMNLAGAFMLWLFGLILGLCVLVPLG